MTQYENNMKLIRALLRAGASKKLCVSVYCMTFLTKNIQLLMERMNFPEMNVKKMIRILTSDFNNYNPSNGFESRCSESAHSTRLQCFFIEMQTIHHF